MASAQTLSLPDRQAVATWAADCVERVVALFEAEAPTDGRPHDAIARARAFSRGELDAASQIRRRFEAGRAAHAVTGRAAIAAARAAGQLSGVAHMAAHGLGAAAYALKAASLTSPDEATITGAELSWQLDQMTPAVREALGRLPALGQDPAGPLGTGLLNSGVLAVNIRALQDALRLPGSDA